jgi:Caspase domain/Sulfatase-modifying factor enzyme 1
MHLCVKVSAVIAMVCCLSIGAPLPSTHAASLVTMKTVIDQSIVGVTQTSEVSNKYALVIGNSRYASSPLKNPVNDAHAISLSFQRLGFQVDERTNLDYRSLNDAVESFGKHLKKDGVAVFYYAGHGVQVNGENYLVPVDADIQTESEIKFKTVNVGALLEKMNDANSNTNIIILDACRNNPFIRSSSRSKGQSGLASIDAPSDTFIAYSTAPNKTADDGNGANGLYTAELIKVLESPGLTLEQIFKKAAKSVKEKSGSKQMPWIASNLSEDFWFIPPVNTPPPIGGDVIKNPLTGMEFITVKGGCFSMGDAFGDGDVDEKPVHEVCLNGFAMAKYDVTVDDFRKFTKVTGYLTEAERYGGCRVANATTWVDDSTKNWKNPGFDQEDRSPVVCVTWNDANEFIKWLSKASGRNYRLPTEAEWEFAARNGGKNERYAGSSDARSLALFANTCDENCQFYTLAVLVKHFRSLIPDTERRGSFPVHPQVV